MRGPIKAPMLSRSDLHGLRNMDERLCLLVCSQYFASKWETAHARTKSPIKVQWSPLLVQPENCTKMRDSLEAQRLASLLISCSVTSVSCSGKASNCMMIQKLMAQPHWQGKLTPRDYAALSPLIWEHVNPYGRFDLDMNTRLALL